VHRGPAPLGGAGVPQARQLLGAPGRGPAALPKVCACLCVCLCVFLHRCVVRACVCVPVPVIGCSCTKRLTRTLVCASGSLQINDVDQPSAPSPAPSVPLCPIDLVCFFAKASGKGSLCYSGRAFAGPCFAYAYAALRWCCCGTAFAGPCPAYAHAAPTWCCCGTAFAGPCFAYIHTQPQHGVAVAEPLLALVLRTYAHAAPTWCCCGRAFAGPCFAYILHTFCTRSPHMVHLVDKHTCTHAHMHTCTRSPHMVLQWQSLCWPLFCTHAHAAPTWCTLWTRNLGASLARRMCLVLR